MLSRIRVDGSGTGLRLSLNACNPPGIAWMVTVAPLARVRVAWVLIDATLRLVPLST